MDEPIDEASRDRFLTLSPDLTLLMWLHMIHQRNAQYQDMRAEGIFSQEDFEGDPRDISSQSLQLSIRVTELVIIRIWHVMKTIQEVLGHRPHPRLHDIFAHVEPGLAALYQFNRQSGRPILEQVIDVYNKSLREQLGEQELQRVISAPRGEQHRQIPTRAD